MSNMTIAKLQDLEYHLSQLQNIKGMVDGRPNLVAFLAAGRSLTLVMQDEYKHKGGFEKWYWQKQDEMKNDELAKFFKKRGIRLNILLKVKNQFGLKWHFLKDLKLRQEKKLLFL
jgi:hypothetical protein